MPTIDKYFQQNWIKILVQHNVMKVPKFHSPSGYFVNFGFLNEINAEQDKQYPALYIEHNI